MLEAGRPVAPQTPADGPHGVDDPDGPIVGGAAELPILSRKPHTLPVYKRLRGEWAARFAVLALACSIFLPNLGSFGLWDPWETHYGEVTRYMLETGDWVHPWWGYKGAKLGDEKGPGEHFYSKPILLFWMEAATIKTIGLSEMAVRFPVALIAMLAMMAVYFCFSKLWGRPRGFFAALVLATCPQFTMLARQSQTDMPFVGTLTIAFSFFMLALFGKREKTSDKRMWAVLCVTILGVLALVLPQLGIVIADVNHEIPARPDGRPGGLWLQWRNTGWMQAATFLAVLLPLVLSMIQPAVANWKSNNGRFDDGFKDQLRRRCYLWIFYAFCGLSLMGKGLMGFMLPGAIIFVYLLLTNEWTLLVQPYKGGWRGRVELLRGIGIFLCVGLPWYIALLAGPEGTAFWNRFFIHDHFNRLGSGVHAIDDGSFEHFLKWLGYGMWPWIMLMPWALLRLWRIKLADRSPENRLRLLLFLWFFLAYTLFTLSSTKFHHYIFPALPPLAILIGGSLPALSVDRSWLGRGAVAFALLLMSLLAWDLHQNPQHLRNQFTYKYDREWPSDEQRPIDSEAPIIFHPSDTTGWEPDKSWAEGDFYKHTPETLHTVLNTEELRHPGFVLMLSIFIGIGLILMLFGLRRVGIGMTAVAAVSMAMWCLNYYMPMLGPHWSQKYLFDRYYDTCVPGKNPPQVDEAFTPLIAGYEGLEDWFAPRPKNVCKEEVISWLLTWRGETFYSNNQIRPIQKENKQFRPWLEEHNKGARFYVHIERTRAKSFEGRVESHVKKLQANPDFAGVQGYDVTLEHNENYWFVLLKANPVCRKGWTSDEVGRCVKQVAVLVPQVR